MAATGDRQAGYCHASSLIYKLPLQSTMLGLDLDLGLKAKFFGLDLEPQVLGFGLGLGVGIAARCLGLGLAVSGLDLGLGLVCCGLVNVPGLYRLRSDETVRPSTCSHR